MQELSKQPDGSALVMFGPASVLITDCMQLIAVHIVSSDAESKRNKKSGRPAGLSPQLEAGILSLSPVASTRMHAHSLHLDMHA